MKSTTLFVGDLDPALPCSTCSHSLECHAEQWSKESTQQLNHFLDMIVELESLALLINHEKDHDTLQIYRYLYGVLQTAISNREKVNLDDALGKKFLFYFC